jgi:hypothetical protein
MVDPWEDTGDILQAKRYGPVCPQSCPLPPGQKASGRSKFWKRFHEYMGDYTTFSEIDPDNKEIDYEDCLYTHVYTPTVRLLIMKFKNHQRT